MDYWKEIWRIIKSSKASTYRNSDGSTAIASQSFRGLNLGKHEEIVSIIKDAQIDLITNFSGKRPDTAASVKSRAVDMGLSLLSYTPGKGEAALSRVRDTIYNARNTYNVPGQDPITEAMETANLYIDAGTAATIYSQGGLPALIINKKSKSIKHNGIRIANPRLTPAQIDTVNESLNYRSGLGAAYCEAAVSGLTYGGSLLFPVFKKDSPASMVLDVPTLMKLGIVGKNCIDRYVSLDRNNAIHIPNWNPTASDFLDPKRYFIPYLGADVAGNRCARIVPVPQAGYWGALMTMGWGNSDIQSWYQAVCNYEGVMSSVPSMLRQMSILVRTFNMDLNNAINGATSLRSLDIENTLAVREASANNPISMDVVGDLKAIQRDFTAVAELTRIIRQDIGAKANMPEEQIWSSDRGAFSSGDQTEGANERQWEGVKYVHGEISSRSKNIAMIEIINALGKEPEIIRALPFTTIEFLSPRIENAEKRASIIRDLSQSVFDLVASGTQLASALDIVLPYGDPHLAPSADVVEKVVKQQKELEDREKEKHDADMALAEAQTKQIEEGGGAEGGAPGGVKRVGKEGGYSKLEQRKKEKTRGALSRREGLQKARGKML